MRSLSSTVSEMPSSCAPSRSVVSYTSTRAGSGRAFVSSLVDMLAPVLVAVGLTADGLGVLGRDGLGLRPGARNGPVVDRVHRAHLGRGAAHEHLLADVEVAAGQVVDP